MSRKIITLTRQQLFKKIWEKPIQQLAKEYGLSDVGLAKVCRRYNIPRPPRGYWRKLETGKKVNTPILPSSHKQWTDEIRFVIDERADLLEKNENIKVIKDQIKEKYCSKAIDYNSGEYKHKYTIKTSHYLSKAKLSKSGTLRYNGCSLEHLNVSPDLLQRALSLLDVILVTLEAHGFEIIWPNMQSNLIIRKDNIKIAFYFSERILIEEIGEISKRKPGNNQYTHDRPSYRSVPTGKLKVEIEKFYCASGIRTLWNDSKHKKIDYYVSDIVASCLMTIEAIKEYRKQTIINEIYSEKRRIEYHKREQENYIYKEKVNLIFDLFEKWKKYNDFRQFVNELKSNIRLHQFANNIDETHNELLCMAEYYARQLDPFINIEKLLYKLKMKIKIRTI